MRRYRYTLVGVAVLAIGLGVSALLVFCSGHGDDAQLSEVDKTS